MGQEVFWPRPLLQAAVEAALTEDLLAGDLTSEAAVPRGTRAEGVLLAKGEGVVAGLPVLEVALAAVGGEARVELRAADGERVQAGKELARVEGDARQLLAAERVAVNLIQRLSGIATLTAKYVAAVAGTGTRIADTRKTSPGLRGLERIAVRAGGGVNHRLNLGAGILLKENHLRLAGGLRAAVARARQAAGPQTVVEVEVESLEELEEALAAQADLVLLDNFGDDEIARAVEIARGRVALEASGGISLERAARIARLGVDFISVGALTHSASALDVSLELYPVPETPARSR